MLVGTEVSILGSFPVFAATQEGGRFVLSAVGTMVHFLLIIAITLGVFWGNFRNKPVSAMNGVRFGVFVAAAGLFLDGVITAPLLVKSYPFYFLKWTVWAGYLLVVLTAFVCALLKREVAQG